ncbi:hypothetical protein FB45DRAFT_36520 [Roridomyces roridus]|uniref:Uncharacterized protein n=1 Tax=Roridomyces roridus TaxID=1738132 RepID=A0AAD7BQT0_9AGAR|nr:hypothetical protein FB45DRAFT_36520 [Roridomyces roridus]
MRNSLRLLNITLSSRSALPFLSWPTSPRTRSSLNLPRRLLSSVSSSPHNLFEYTSGLWLVNNDLRLAERKHVFDIEELRRLAAQSVDRTIQDVDTIEKLAEGGFNRVFLITMHDGFQMIARIP